MRGGKWIKTTQSNTPRTFHCRKVKPWIPGCLSTAQVSQHHECNQECKGVLWLRGDEQGGRLDPLPPYEPDYGRREEDYVRRLS